MRPLALQAQVVDTTVIDALGTIAMAQVVMAVVLVIMGLVVLGGALLVLVEFRSLRRLLRDMLVTMEELRPRVGPLLDQLQSLTGDASAMTGDMRRRVDNLLYTIEDVNRSVKRGAEAVEARAERFGAVLDVVQTEAEELLLDAASTARGVHETARVLRQPVPRSQKQARPLQDAGDAGYDDDEEGTDEQAG